MIAHTARKLFVSAALALVIAAAWVGPVVRPARVAARVGGTPPAFTLPAATGGPSTGSFRMSEHLGTRPVVILFWATWCVPCQQELPYYQTLYARYQSQGLRVVAISMDASSTITRVGPAARRLGVTYDVVTDLDTRVTSQLNPRRAAPFSIWVSREGRIAWEREGFAPSEQATIEAGIADLMSTTTPAPAGPPLAEPARPLPESGG